MANLFLVERRQTARVTPDGPPDASERAGALDIRKSWIVEAPAGSGKTGLLMQRLLKLLADESVTEPEQVLAITFTVKATAELRERVLHQLDDAATGARLQSKFDRETRVLAEEVLRRDTLLGWGLRERPQRLRVRTIDAVCGEIARSLPVLSGGSGRSAPITDPSPFYREAARQTLLQLGGADAALDQALRTLLLHRDGNLPECERLIAEMLSLREQWGNLVPLTGAELTDETLDATVLPKLERSLDQAICAGLQQLARSIPPDVLNALVYLASEMGHTGGYQGAPSPIALCAGLDTAPAETAEHLDHWRALIHLLTTRETVWRKSIARNHLGFEIEKHHSARLKELVSHLAEDDELLTPMKRVRTLPPARYPPEQWVVAKALFRILHRALVELQLVFAERGACDFAELGLLARTALRRDAHGDDLAAALGMRLQHLLVDEMQDTSTSQYELIELLTEGWDGHSQTVFLVGDPKQSIYRFRQARVERFVRTMRTGRLGELPIGCLRLTANFRTQRGLVEQVNDDFSRLFPRELTPLHPEDVPFVAAEAVRDAVTTEDRAWHTALLPSDDQGGTRQRQAKAEALAIRRLVESWRAKPLPEGRRVPWKIAVLVRSRNHLTEVVAALKQDGGTGSVPFRAVDIEPLAERQEVLDLFALTRTLLHPADRVAWLAILRAPWCGLKLTDLHLLAGADDPAWAEMTVGELIERRKEFLSDDGQLRLNRLWTLMRAAAKQRGTLSLAQLVARSWRSLGGDLWLNAEELGNATRFLRLLDELESAPEGVDLSTLQERLKKLYAEQPAAPEAIDLMTIHGAKGLEWDVVIVPALERKGRSTRSRLLTWMELDSVDPESAHVVLAPIPGRGEASRELNAWLKGMEDAREAAERKRLLYVACTRAREELHLFASPEVTVKGEVSVRQDSLLKAAWPAAKDFFPAAAKVQPIRVATPVSTVAQEGLALAAGANAADEVDAAEPLPLLRRLPLRPNAAVQPEANNRSTEANDAQASNQPFFERPQGSFAARAFGTAVHAFMELLAKQVAAGEHWEELTRTLPRWSSRVAAVLRSEGLPPAAVDRLTQRVLAALRNTLADDTGRWLLSPHPGAASELALIGGGEQQAGVRLDRTFRAGTVPGASGGDFIWVIDFKTATHAREGLEEFLEREKAQYAAQIETYARVLGGGGLKFMLYYPLMPAAIWWPGEGAN